MFGSTSRGKSSMASAPEKEDAAASKGAKSEEDADCGATCSDPHHDESMLRETSPQRSLSNLHTRECFALLFGVEVTPTVEDGVGSHILPTYTWTKHIIFDILSPTIEDTSQVVILNPMVCLVFRGPRSRGEGFTYGEALALFDVYHWETTTWIGPRVKMHCIMHTLQDARGDLRMVRDQEHYKTLECIWHQYQENEKYGQSAPNCGRGYVCSADCYFAKRFLKKQPEQRLGGHPADVRDCRSQSREQGHEGWHVQPSRDRPQGLYAHHETPERVPRGHPLGGGHPERVPQESCDAFHSAREDQSDMVSGSKSKTEVEEWDDIITYDTETSRYTMVADRGRRIVCNHHRMNKCWHHEWHPGYSKTKWLSLLIFETLPQTMRSPTMIGEVMLTTTSEKAIPPSSSGTQSCVHWRGTPATLQNGDGWWGWLSIASWKSSTQCTVELPCTARWWASSIWYSKVMGKQPRITMSV